MAKVEAFYSLSMKATRFVRDGEEVIKVYDEDLPQDISYGKYIRLQKDFIENAYSELEIP